MKRKLLLSLALIGLMQWAFAFDMTNVTATYLQNYAAPFTTTGEGLVSSNLTRFQRLAAPWVTVGDVGTMGTDYTSWHVDMNKSPNFPAVHTDSAGVMTLTAKWDGFAATTNNMKVFQTVTLPAGDYELDIRRAQDWSGASQAYLVAATGTGLPNIENFSTGALASAVFSSAVQNIVSIKFKLAAETTVSLGCVASLASWNCVTIADFKLFQTLGSDYRALKNLVATAKGFTAEKYPLGTISGTYSQAKWDALQTAITTAETFIAAGETDTQANVDAQQTALQKAIDDLNTSMVLPFKLSDNLTSYWYQIRDMRATKSYWQVGEYIGDTTLPTALIMSQTGDNTVAGQLFKMVEAPSGYYYIVNKSTELPLSMTGDMMQTVVDSIPLEFNISRGTDISHYIISLRESGSQLNSYASYTPQYIGLYNNVNDPGNNWEFVEFVEVGQTNFNDLKTAVASALIMTQTNYPAQMYAADKWNAFVTTRTAATTLLAKETDNPQPAQTEVDAMITTLQTAIDELNAAFIPQVQFSTPENSIYYYVQDKRAATNYWLMDGANRLALATALDSVSDLHMFKFVKSGTGNGFKIYNKAFPNNALSISPDDANLIQMNETMADTTWVMGRTPAKDMNYFTVGLESNPASQMNSYATQQFVGFWTPSADDPGNDWKFVQVVKTGIKQTTVTDLGIYVSNRHIVSKDAAAKLTIFTAMGQKVNTKAELAPGVYLVKVAGKTGTAKVIVK